MQHICYDYVVRLLISDNGFSLSRLIWLIFEVFHYMPQMLNSVISHIMSGDLKTALLCAGLSYSEILIDVLNIYQYMAFSLYDFFTIAIG